MDINDEDPFTRKCYKCEQPVFDSLNIVYNSSNSKLVLWNKYQIFVYEDTNLECAEKIFIPAFKIHLLIASNNYILCLDSNGKVQIISLKFKSATQKTLKIPSQPRDESINHCIRYKEDHILSLKYEADAYFLCLHRINADFNLEKKMILLCGDEHWQIGENSKEKYLLTSYSVNENNFEHIHKMFKNITLQNETTKSYDLVVVSIDKLNVYACLFSPKNNDEEIALVKLYSCPAEIRHIEIVDAGDLQLIIGLAMGTVIRLSLYNTAKTTDIVHLNSALYKVLPIKNGLIYSDGTTMWKAENTFSDLKLTQFIVKNAKDFVKCGDDIICTTFNMLTYKFSIDDRNAYLHPETYEYCAAEMLFNNSTYLDKLFEETDKNNELIRKLEIEQHYITALSFSKREDVVNDAVKSCVTVFETYEEASTKECTLTEEIKKYFSADTWIFLVTITNSSIYNTLNKILTDLSDSIKIYITLSTRDKILKTTCIKLDQPLKTVNYLIPLKTNETEINVNIKIVINIPGALDMNKTLTTLYKNDIVLTPEHFIKTSHETGHCLKTNTKPTDLIQKISEIQYGTMFNFTDISNLMSQIHHTFYVKLPKDYEQILKMDQCTRYNQKTTLIMQQLRSEEFLKSKEHITFLIGNEKLKVNIHNDGFSNPLLKVTSGDAKIALSMRNFFANVLYKDYEEHEPGKEFIGYSLYTTTENFQKAVKRCIGHPATLTDFLPLMDQFERNIIGALPL